MNLGSSVEAGIRFRISVSIGTREPGGITEISRGGSLLKAR